jgi:hypothetical protein
MSRFHMFATIYWAVTIRLVDYKVGGAERRSSCIIRDDDHTRIRWFPTHPFRLCATAVYGGLHE